MWTADNPYAFDQFQELQNELVPLSDQGVQVVAIHVGPSPPDYVQLCANNGEGVLCLLDAEQKYFASGSPQIAPHIRARPARQDPVAGHGVLAHDAVRSA